MTYQEYQDNARRLLESLRLWITQPGSASGRFLTYLGILPPPPQRPPEDKWNLLFIILFIQGLGSLTAFNMFITAKDYFVEYKLENTEYASSFLAKLGIALELPNIFCTWINVFVRMGGDLTNRIVWSLSFEILVFLFTVILAMLDSSEWPGGFFWLTMASAFVINGSNAVFLNSAFRVTSVLPMKYSGAVVLGCNVCGVVVVLVNWLADVAAGRSRRTSGIYFFLSGILVMLLCLDLFLALPLNKLYRYYAKRPQQAISFASLHPPYWTIFKQSWKQSCNVWLIFFVTFAVFPAVHSDILSISGLFGSDFTRITCFLTYNITLLFGSFTAAFFYYPSRRWLWLFATARLAFIPFFLLCNYRPQDKGKLMQRSLPVVVQYDGVYVGAMLMGWSSGHGATLGMMYVSEGEVEAQHASTAGMIGGAMVVTGVVCGYVVSMLAPVIVTRLHIRFIVHFFDKGF